MLLARTFNYSFAPFFSNAAFPMLGITCKWCLRKAELSWFMPASGSLENSQEEKHQNHVNHCEDLATSTTSSDDCTEPKAKRVFVSVTFFFHLVSLIHNSNILYLLFIVQKFEARLFHPLEEHQNWCPWIEERSESESQDRTESGWKILLGILSRHCAGIDFHLAVADKQV